MSWPPLPPLYSLVLPTYSPETDVAEPVSRGGFVRHPEINCFLEVGIGEALTISVDRVGGRTSVCNARGEEQEEEEDKLLHDCCDWGGGGGSARGFVVSRICNANAGAMPMPKCSQP